MYTPTTWQTGDTITATALNKLEQGVADAFSDVNLTSPQDGQTLVYDAQSGKWKNGAVSGGGGVLVVHIDDDTGALDRTWKEITDAGFSVISQVYDGSGPIWIYGGCEKDFTPDGACVVSYLDFSIGEIRSIRFVADSENGYPVYNET